MKLRKRPGTEIRKIESPAQVKGDSEKIKESSHVEEVECEIWEDLDGNAYAWTPVGSGVISIEIADTEDTIAEAYKRLKESKKKPTEERIAELEETLIKVLKKLSN